MTRTGLAAVAIFIALGTCLVACKPELGDPASLITEPRILAVRSEPAEVKPDRGVTFRALVATHIGDASPAVAWGFCTEPAPLSSNNVVNDTCLAKTDPLPAGGIEVQGIIPIAACSVFGPTPPAPRPGEPPLRPHDADVTGGYYQPVRAVATLDGAALPAGIGLARITCDLANAPFDVAADFSVRYHPNVNPTLVGVTALTASARGGSDGDGTALGTEPAMLPARTAVTLRATWAADSVETFPVFDPESRTLVDHREAMRVSWFVSGGELSSERTGRSEADTDTFADDTWTTPDPGPAYLWVVLRDSRGGVAFAAYPVMLAP